MSIKFTIIAEGVNNLICHPSVPFSEGIITGRFHPNQARYIRVLNQTKKIWGAARIFGFEKWYLRGHWRVLLTKTVW
jgi:hypothetical protein